MIFDTHAATLALRSRYALACAKAPPTIRPAIDAIQGALESLSPRTLALYPLQTLLCETLKPHLGSPVMQAYLRGVMVFFYSMKIPFEGELHDRLLSVA